MTVRILASCCSQVCPIQTSNFCYRLPSTRTRKEEAEKSEGEDDDDEAAVERSGGGDSDEFGT